ncbi:MAG TPA: AAA family ATPase [Longimicrobiales bacterium]|nr:AAA family ATPase [Longimicrobiales bacterium]
MSARPSTVHLRRIELRRPRAPDEAAAFPFTVPAIRELGALDLTAPVTFFVGENGSGKSTLLEAIAAAAGSPTVGAEEVGADETLAAQRRLGKHLRLTWTKRARRGFFLRAEDFFGFARRVARLRSEMLRRLEEIDEEFAGASDYVKGLAAGPARASLAEMEQRYGVDLDARSHGESFLKLFQSRFVPDGLYLLDEPEAPLSPQNQITLLAMLRDMVEEQSQFLIATHSPILLAFPGAAIVSFDEAPPAIVPYEELQHVQLTRAFLNGPEGFLRRL